MHEHTGIQAGFQEETAIALLMQDTAMRPPNNVNGVTSHESCTRRTSSAQLHQVAHRGAPGGGLCAVGWNGLRGVPKPTVFHSGWIYMWCGMTVCIRSRACALPGVCCRSSLLTKSPKLRPIRRFQCRSAASEAPSALCELPPKCAHSQRGGQDPSLMCLDVTAENTILGPKSTAHSCWGPS